MAPSRTLLVGPAWIGDMVMAGSLARLLAARGHTVDAVAPPWSFPLVERLEGVAQTFLLGTGHGEIGFGRRLALARELAHRGYGQAIVLPRSLKAALLPWLARIPRRTGLRGEFRYGLINDMRAIAWTRAKPMIERFCALGLEPGEPLPEPLPRPVLAVDTGARLAVMDRLGVSGERPVAACMPGAEHGPAKRWPYFAELARRLHSQGFDVWLLGGPGDAAAGDAIAAGSGNTAVNLCGKTKLVEAIDLLGGVDVAISNDSGLMHIAAAVGVPVVGLYGSSSPVYTPPLAEQREILYLALECSPCFARECPLGHFRCMRDMSVDSVLDAALHLLRGGEETATG
ncbi:MAG TPA: lipopolysaccharide heptosyltransferase II [Woeseiaceae bacterium]